MSGPLSPSIRCRGLSVGYGGDPVLEDLTFAVEEGSALAVVGRSGCGKSTLLKTLAGTLDPLEGEATVLGARLPRSPPSGALGYIPQSLGLVTHATVLRNVLHGTLSELGWTRSLLGRFPESAERDAREAIEAVGLAGTERRRVAALSGGQRRRVAIARAFVQKPRVLLADEMLSELDPETARSVVDCLRALQTETGMTVVVVEHDLEVAEEISERLLRLEAGGVQVHAESRSNPPRERGPRGSATDP